MHLSDYMAEEGLRDEDVAAALGKSRVSVSRWRRKLIRPDWETIQAIRVWSNEQVAEPDWRAVPAEAERAVS